MNTVFPRKWFSLIARTYWVEGPWDAENGLDREQWADPDTGYPCLALRSEVIGTWCGYVGVYPYHPAYGIELACLRAHGGITWHGHTCGVQYIAPAPEEPGACIDPSDPKSILDVSLMPDRLWFFGFDTCHAGDRMPLMHSMLGSGKGFGEWAYRDINYVKSECANIAKNLENHRLGLVMGTP